MTFKAGDIVEVIIAGPGDCVRRGMRGTVLGRGLTLDRVEVDYGLENTVQSLANCIRKVPPDSIDSANLLKVVRWTDCPWKPAGVRA